MVEAKTGGKACGAATRALWAALFGLAALACSEDSPRCAADRSLAQACADGACPPDLQTALNAGRACDSSFAELWQEGNQSAIGIGTGLGGRLYHFDGSELVGVEYWTDVLENDCPTFYVNGRRTVNVHPWPDNPAAPEPQACALCADWAIDDDRPVCP